VTTDASIDGIAFALGQRDDDGILRMIYAGGRATADYERRYGPMDLEGVAVILAFKNAPHMLDNGLPVRVLTDSRPLVDFFTNATPISDPAYAPVRARLVAALQGFNISWHHVEGEQNAFMDAASRAAWTPTSGLEQSGPDTQAHTLLPPSAQAPARVAMIRPFSPSGQTPDVSEEDDTFDGDDDAEDDDDYVSVASDEPEGDELDLRAAEHQGGDAHDPIMISSDSEPSTPRTTGDDASVDNGVLQSLESSSVEVNAASITDDASVDSAVSEPSAEAAAPVFSSLPLLHDESLPPGTDIDIESNFALDRRAMAEAQRSDRSLNALFAHAHGITQKSNKVKKRNPSIDIDGRLFVLHGQQRAAVLVVPAELVPREINAAHERIGHRGADATLKELQLTRWWPGMEEQVRTWCDRCPICQTRLRAQRATPDLAQHPRAARFDAVHMDLMPMPSSSTGNKYALVVVDRTSGAAIATPMRSKSTNDILDAYQREWVDVYGSPKTLHPDDALELNSKAVRAMCTRHGTSLVASAPYNKQANGLAERFIQTIKRALLARLHGRDVGSWDKELSSVVASYMTTAQAVRGGVSPFELTYGQAPVSQEARVLRVVPLRPEFAVEEGKEAARAAKQRVDEIVPKALEARDKAAASPLAAAQAAPVFALGDVVWVENTDRASEATAFENRQKRFGPYIVHSINPSRTRAQLRVLATGRVVTDRRSGNAGKPVLFATRRLTKTSGDVTQRRVRGSAATTATRCRVRSVSRKRHWTRRRASSARSLPHVQLTSS
jgi:hypothetical protein